MSYYVADVNGYIADVASIGGLRELREWATQHPVVDTFLRDGKTEDIEGLIVALREAPASGSVNSTRKALIEAAQTAKELLILSDGANAAPVTEKAMPWGLYCYAHKDAAARLYSEGEPLLVSLWLDDYEAEELALLGGEEPATMHLTLAYCRDVSQARLGRAIGELACVALSCSPLDGRVADIRRFDASVHSDNLDVIVAQPQIEGLAKLREAVVSALDKANVEAAHDFTWTPHVTLAYVESDVDTVQPPEFPSLMFDAITLSMGDKRLDIPLKGRFNPSEPRDNHGRWSEGYAHISHVELRGFDTEDARARAESFATAVDQRIDAMRDYDGLSGLQVKSLMLLNQEKLGTAGARYTPLIDAIEVAYGPRVSQQANETATGPMRERVASGPMGAVDHELGHVVFEKILTDDQRKLWGKLWNKNFDSISAYAATSEKEGFSEAFAAYVGGAKLPKNVNEFLAKHIGSKRPTTDKSLHADDIEWREHVKQAESHGEPALKRDLLRAWNVRSRHWERAVKTENWELLGIMLFGGPVAAQMTAAVTANVSPAFLRGVDMGERPLRRQQIKAERPASDYAQQWAQRRAASLLPDPKSVKDLVKSFVQDALSDGFTVPETARLIAQVVGLDARRMQALERYADELQQAGVTGSRLLAKTEKYATELRNARAETIARTEILMAMNAGQHRVWEKALQDGRISDDMRKIWIATVGCCDECDELSTEDPKAIDAPFVDTVQFPPLHPNCRCTMGLVRV